jgi:opacity protein-like surface antigen
MKEISKLTMAGVSLLLVAASGHAESLADKLYLDAGIGASVQQSTDIRVSMLGNSGNVQFNPGIRGELAVGYNINKHFAAELESGVIWNSVDSILGNNGSSSGYRADIYQIPTLVNFVYRPLHGKFQPYIGVGAGVAATIFDSSNIPLYSPSFSDTDWTFAYQGELGFKYALSSRTELGVAYKFFGTTEHDWSEPGYTLKTDGTMAHTFMVTFTWKL